jgi:predicted DsbA family dithiol-disulfide isomerase
MNSIAIYSDLICPWCYIGKRRMEEALRQLPAETQVSRSWHPFQLNPEMPAEGLDRKMYRSRKFGYPEQFAQEALGHNSKAVHRAYARKAQVLVAAIGRIRKMCKDRKPVCRYA